MYTVVMTLNINVETKNIIKIFALAVGFTIGVFALIKMYDALMLLLIAFFVALALNPPVSFLSKFMPGKRRGPAIFVVLLLTIALFGFLLASIIPPVVRETSRFARSFPSTVNESFYKNERVQGYVEEYKLQDDIDNLIDSGKDRLADLGDEALNSVGSVGGQLVSGLTVLVLTVLMLTGGSKLLHQLADRLYRDTELRERHEKMAVKMYRSVTGYALGQVSVALIASLCALGVLALLGIPYAVPLAGIIFILGLIPLIGNTLGAILVVFSSLILKDFTAASILLVFFILYQQIENITLQPIVQGKTTNLPPLVIFASVVLGVALIGPLGGLFAIPAAGCVKVLLADYLDHRDDLKAGDNPKNLLEKMKHRTNKVLNKT